eukprot:TRINITY_DN516_c1_g1_i1.p2 TRINITY_DN516_c1_g1~~TRINITY_DN516_c1_g1_i1.p2  ORF type:complete len:1714 (-),score=696.54 TRINITY_DN516_c1_g1_i1:40-5181(-)
MQNIARTPAIAPKDDTDPIRLYGRLFPQNVSILKDYGPSEAFFVDGDSLLMEVLANPHLDATNFQTLPAVYLFEEFLHRFVQRGGVLKVIFFQESARIWQNPAHSLLRQIIIRHLSENPVIEVVTRFQNWRSSEWKKYLHTDHPSFVLAFDANRVKTEDPALTQQLQKLQTGFILDCLFSHQHIVFTSEVIFKDDHAKGYMIRSETLNPTSKLPALIATESEAILSALPKPLEKTSLEAGFKKAIEVLKSSGNLRNMVAAPILAQMYAKGGIFAQLVRAFVLHLVLIDSLPIRMRSVEINPSHNEVTHIKEIPNFIAEFSRQAEALFAVFPPKGEFKEKFFDFIDGRLFRFLVEIQLEFNLDEKSFGLPGDAKAQLDSIVQIITELKKDFKLFPTLTKDSTWKQVEKPAVPAVDDAPLALGDAFFSDWVPKVPEQPAAASQAISQEISQAATRISWRSPQKILTEALITFSNTEEEDKVAKAKTPRDKKFQLKRQGRNQQLYFKFMQRYAASLEGTAIINRKMVTKSAEEPKKEEKDKPDRSGGKKGTPAAKSKKEAMTDQINQERALEARKKEIQRWEAGKAPILKTKNDAQALRELNLFLNSSSDPLVQLEIQDLKLKRFLNLARDKKKDEEHNLESVIQAYIVANDIVDMYTNLPQVEISEKPQEEKKKAKAPKPGAKPKKEAASNSKKEDPEYLQKRDQIAKEALIDALTAIQSLGFEPTSKQIEKDLKISSKGKRDLDSGISLGMSSQRFQLTFMGHLLKRSITGPADPRVDFIPDDWQKALLDVVDKNESALVCAPTSSGKTFISYYCMEKVMRSDSGILIFVSPTKALVNQVAAQVYRLFGVEYGVFVPEYQFKTFTCRILVTVPECLEVLLTSPTYQETWIKKIQYVIFDEVHSVGDEESGLLWEHCIQAVRCPFLALSATVGNPEEMQSWMQKIKETQWKTAGNSGPAPAVRFISHNDRYSDLMKMVYIPPAERTEAEAEMVNIHRNFDYKKDSVMKYLHPCATVTVESIKNGFPKDLALVPRDSLDLYNAMDKLVPKDDKPARDKISKLNPDTRFGRRITRSEAKAYEADIKNLLLEWISQGKSKYVNDIFDSFKLISQDISQAESDWETKRGMDTNSNQYLFEGILDLLVSLNATDKLPCIVFNFDRYVCEQLCRYVVENLEISETKKRDGESKNLKSQEKDREKQMKNAKKNRDKKATKNDLEEALMEETAVVEEVDEIDPQFSFIRKDTALPNDELREIMRSLRNMDKEDPLFKALQRGVGVHHEGLSTKYRQAVEVLFRSKHLRIVIATGTLALGIHMPCKTVVFAGDSIQLEALQYRQMSGRAGRRGYDDLGHVVFYGIPQYKICRLMTSDIPKISGHFPHLPAFIMRMLVLHEKAENKAAVKNVIQNELFNPLVEEMNPSIKAQLPSYLRNTLDFLMNEGLISPTGSPQNFAGIPHFMYWAEPGCFLFVRILRSGILHKICTAPKPEDQIPVDLVQILAQIFGRRIVPNNYSPSEVDIRLSPAPQDVTDIIDTYNRDVVKIYSRHIKMCSQIVPRESLTLPLTADATFSNQRKANLSGKFVEKLEKSNHSHEEFSPFVDLGQIHEFQSLRDLIESKPSEVYLDTFTVPIIETRDKFGTPVRLNGYLIEFFNNGNLEVLSEVYGVPPGEAWQVLKDFLTCVTGVHLLSLELSGGNTSDPLAKNFKKILDKLKESFEAI